jgi:hypothetical protein
MTDKEEYFLRVIETSMMWETTPNIIKRHLRHYEEEEEYLKCAGIKLGIEFVRFKKLLDLTIEQNDKRDN